MGREKIREKDTTKDPGSFMQIPTSVMECSNYARLGYPARALLFELARQFKGHNNGRLLLSMKYLRRFGWNSCDVVSRAKKELLFYGFIYETVKGYRPNKASWYAITWRTLDRIDGYDYGALKGFMRSAYKSDPLINPASGTTKRLTAPSAGIKASTLVPHGGAVRH